MYRDYFGFQEKPFGLTPDTRFVFLSDNHREGFAHLWYGLHQGGGFIVLTGEIGTGKTTMLRALLTRLDPDRWRSALIFNPALTADSLLREILREFGLSDRGRDKSRLVRNLNAYLLRENAAGRSVLLILDEAQNLEPEILEEIRLLSNLETENRKLLHIVLVGQPELREVLQRPELRQLRQRISVHYHLRGMNAENTRRYIEHRLGRAGGGDNPLFSLRAFRKIYRRTWGIPRVINILCDRCLLLGFASDRKCITPRMVGKAARELQSDHRPMAAWLPGPVTRVFLPGILLVMLAIWSLAHFLLVVPNRQVSIPSALEATTWSPAATSPVRRQDSVAAFNAIARVWQVPELAEGEKIGDMGDLWRAARDRGLEIRRVRGSLATLLQLNYPVLVKVKGGGEGDLIAVLAETRGEIRVVPESGPLSRQGLNQLWNGEAYLLWRNNLDLPAVVLPGTRGPKVKALQQLLSAAGGKELRIDGIYGRETSSSLAEFQRKQGLEPDEAVGMPTLLRLYQSVESFKVPRLRGGDGDEHSSQGAAEG